MSVVVVGIEHHQVSLDLLERVAIGDADLGKVLGTLRDRANLQESVVLSTCLRTEVYAVVDRFHDAVHEIEEVLAEKAGLPPSALEEKSTIRFDDDVAAHLFSVASGLESAVLGEGEVLGQVRRAWERAQGERVSGPVLSELFRHAVQAGKRVRSETAISRGTTSFSHAAVELAEARRAGGLAGATVAVVGAGTMGAGVLQALLSLSADRRPAELVLVNRTATRAEELVRSLPEGAIVRTAGTAELIPVVGVAEVVFSAVEAEGHVVTAADLAPAGGRSGRPLLVVDLGVPRNIDPAAAGVDGVTLLDMDHLSSAVAQAVEERRGEADRARSIVAEDVARYRAAARARGAAPVIAALRNRLEETRAAELERRRGQFGELSPSDWEQVDAVTRSVLAKLLHEPTVLLRETAGTPRGERLVEALRLLFDL
ncbi:MAG TPA: glutamyl-tRNA reductase [Acidimicrobiales bacterium]|nr:glutamyl-tRNA reductase [Acidimicrobiales bacterium]